MFKGNHRMPTINRAKVLAFAKTTAIAVALAALGAFVASLTGAAAGVDPLTGAAIGVVLAFCARLTQALEMAGVEPPTTAGDIKAVLPGVDPSFFLDDETLDMPPSERHNGVAVIDDTDDVAKLGTVFENSDRR